MLNQLTLSKCTENAFISSGFDTWKNATKAFERHRKSACHQEAVLKWHYHLKRANITTQFDQQIIRDHQKNRHCLEMLFTSVEYLARQALPFRGHSEERGNFYQLVALRGSKSDDLKTWMRRTRSYMSHDIQNKILQIMAHQILRAIIKNVSSSNWFAIIADEATDASLVEQVKCTCCVVHVLIVVCVTCVMIILFSLCAAFNLLGSSNTGSSRGLYWIICH